MLRSRVGVGVRARVRVKVRVRVRVRVGVRVRVSPSCGYRARDIVAALVEARVSAPGEGQG